MKTVVDSNAVLERPRLVSQVVERLGEDRAFLRSSYPNFDAWFAMKVLPGIWTGERTIVLEERHGSVAGLVIVKHTATEKKLCTLRVRPGHENRGLGVRLFERAFELLHTQEPLLSVASQALPQFDRIFSYFGFAERARYRSLYRLGCDEVAFNGLLQGVQSSKGLDLTYREAA